MTVVGKRDSCSAWLGGRAPRRGRLSPASRDRGQARVPCRPSLPLHAKATLYPGSQGPCTPILLYSCDPRQNKACASCSGGAQVGRAQPAA